MNTINHPEMLTKGVIAHVVRFVFLCRIPVLSKVIIWVYAKIMLADYYGHKLSDFDCLLSFFLRTRDLSVKMRKLKLIKGVVSPAEGEITWWDNLSHNDTMPIKGAGFTVSRLLGFDAPHFQTGMVFYLSPGNYHHVHAPCNMTVEGYFEIPGKLDSVAPSVIEKKPMLLAENLRHVILATTEEGMRMALVLVGAQNVGSIHCPRLAGWEQEEGVTFKKGEALGYFSLGSTVVMLVDQDVPKKDITTVDVLDQLFGEDVDSRH